MSAAEQHVVGWPLPASVVARTESMRSRVAMLRRADTREDACTNSDLRAHYNDQMRALRYVYVLALVVWLGGMVVLGAVVAPAIFQTLQASVPATGRELGGAVFTVILERFHYIAYASGALLLVTLAAMALLGPRPRGLAVRAALVAAMLAVALYSGAVVLRNADGIR